MWYAVHDKTGRLVSTGTVIADPLPDGLTAVPLGDDAPTGEWDAAQKVFVPLPVEKAALEPIDLLRRFTFGEEVAIRTAAKSDVGIEVFLARLAAAKIVRLDHPDTIGGLQYLVAKGLISAERAAEVLA